MHISTDTEVPVSLQEITAATVREITDLSVAPEQAKYVASNAVSIAQAYFNRDAWFRAVYAGEIAVGFVMLRGGGLVASGQPTSELSLWRFMLDHRFQRRGYGRKALNLLVAHARSRPAVARLETSYVPGPQSPREFYLSFGFRHTGKIKANGEACLELLFEQA